MSRRRRMVVASTLMGLGLVAVPAWFSRPVPVPITGVDAATAVHAAPFQPAQRAAQSTTVADPTVPVISTDRPGLVARHDQSGASQFGSPSGATTAVDADGIRLRPERDAGDAAEVRSQDRFRTGSDSRGIPAFNQPRQIPGGLAGTWPPAGPG